MTRLRGTGGCPKRLEAAVAIMEKSFRSVIRYITERINMLKIGEKQILRVDKQVPFGVYLTGDVPNERVLLPRSQVPEGTAIGDELEVFLYKDSEDRLIATRKEPKLTLHQVGYLTVIQVSRIGAFLDWGLDKDLLLPYHEQPRDRVKEGQTVLVAVYLDKSERLCATMNVYPWLRTDSPYQTGDQVTGIVYETSRNFGAFVAVDSIYSALIPRRELTREYKPGDIVQARVTSVKPDGKLDLSVREKSYLQIDADVETILGMLRDGGGSIPFTDKASPEEIREKAHMSKNEFKRAIGHLLKENKISIEENRIVML